jgi:hypothetical protein
MSKQQQVEYDELEVMRECIGHYICSVYHVGLDQARKRPKSDGLLQARQALMFALRLFWPSTERKYEALGRYVGKHHTAVRHAVKVSYERYKAGDPTLIKIVAELRKQYGRPDWNAMPELRGSPKVSTAGKIYQSAERHAPGFPPHSAP